jgi:hypothetical protein
MPPVLQIERIANLSYGRRLLPCGILFQAMSLVGQTRSFGDVGSMSGLTETGHSWAIYEYTPLVLAMKGRDYAGDLSQGKLMATAAFIRDERRSLIRFPLHLP